MYQCHWTHVHDRHEWTPLVGDPEADRVLHVFPDQPVTCPGLTAQQVADRDAQAAARIERRPVGTLHVNTDHPGVIVRGANVYVRPLDDAKPGEPLSITGWTEVGYIEDSLPLVASPEADSEMQTWTAAFEPQTFTLTGVVSNVPSIVDPRVNDGTSLSLTYFACPITAPVKRRGLTGKRYRIARRAYGRAMRRWRRAGSPMAERNAYIPRVRIAEAPGHGVSFVALGEGDQ